MKEKKETQVILEGIRKQEQAHNLQEAKDKIQLQLELQKQWDQNIEAKKFEHLMG